MSARKVLAAVLIALGLAAAGGAAAAATASTSHPVADSQSWYHA